MNFGEAAFRDRTPGRFFDALPQEPGGVGFATGFGAGAVRLVREVIECPLQAIR